MDSPVAAVAGTPPLPPLQNAIRYLAEMAATADAAGVVRIPATSLYGLLMDLSCVSARANGQAAGPHETPLDVSLRNMEVAIQQKIDAAITMAQARIGAQAPAPPTVEPPAPG